MTIILIFVLFVFIGASNEEKESLTINIEHIDTQYLNKKSASMFSLSAVPFLLLDGELAYLESGSVNYLVETSIALQDMNIEVVAIKSIQQNSDTLIAIALRNMILIYRFEKTIFLFIHTIHPSGLGLLKDFHFIEKDNQLYLIVLSTDMLLFKWLGTKFSLVRNIRSNFPSALLHFKHFFDDFIITLEHQNEKTSVNVYKFIENSLEQITKLPHVIEGSKIITYKIKNTSFFVVFSNYATVYKWHNYKFVYIKSFKSPCEIQRIFVKYIEGVPVIFVFLKNEINIIQATVDSFEIVYKMPLELPTIITDHVLVNTENTYYLYLLGKNKLSDGLVLLQLTFVIEMKTPGLENDIINIKKCFVALESFIYDKLRTKIMTKRSEIHSVEKLQNGLKIFQERIVNLTNSVEKLLSKNLTVLKENITILHTKFITQKLSAKNITLKKLNNIEWRPELWLSSTFEQNITGPVILKKLSTNYLVISNQSNLFKDILLRNRVKQTLHITTKIESLNTLNINSTLMKLGTQDNILSTSSRTVLNNTKTTYRVKDLFVTHINGLNWEEFLASVASKGSPIDINGYLTFRNFKGEHFAPTKMNGIKSKVLMTTSTNQNISSVIKFGNVDVKNVVAKNVNGLDFVTDVVRTGNLEVSGPVSIKDLYIEETLRIIGPVDRRKLKFNGTRLVGSNVSDLLQIYSNKVKIMGNLKVKNIQLLEGTKLIVSGQESILNFPQKYWLKNTYQIIPVHFEVAKGVTSPHLDTIYLNDREISKYVTNDDSKFIGNFYFSNLHVDGNITLNTNGNYYPNLRKLESEAVKLNGSYTISGRKTFKGTLIVENLTSNTINNVQVSQAFYKNMHFNGTTIARKGIIKNNHTPNMLRVFKINNINLEDLKANTVYIDRCFYFKKLNFDNIKVVNLTVASVNEKSFEDFQNQQRNFIKNVTVNGDVKINNLNQLLKINNIDTDLLAVNCRSKANYKLVKNFMIFEKHVNVRNLNMAFLNGNNFYQLTQNLFYKSWPQKIPAHFTFQNIRSTNLITDFINDIYVKDLINVRDKRPANFTVESLYLKEPVFLKSVESTCFQCNLIIDKLQFPEQKRWKSIVVRKSITIINQENGIAALLKYAVLKKRNNLISAPVNFSNVLSKNILFKDMVLVNGIDLNKLFLNALMKTGKNQMITGRKEFVTLSALSVLVVQDANISLVNGFSLKEINDSIINKKDINNIIIRGEKVLFGGLQTGKIKADTVLNINPNVIVSMNYMQQIPRVSFTSLKVLNNFDIEKINNMDLNEFLNSILLLNSKISQVLEGDFYLNNVHLRGKMVVKNKINDIDMSDVVFDVGFQKITANKTFISDLVVNEDLNVTYLNNKNIHEEYRKGLFVDENITFNGNIVFNMSPLHMQGITTSTLNGIAVKSIEETLKMDAVKVKVDLIEETMENIENVIEYSEGIIKTLDKRVEYIENWRESYIELPNPIKTTSFYSKGHAIVNVLSSVNGHYCGFPKECVCFIQDALEITPSLSVNKLFPTKINQRTYTFDDDSISIHVITNTVSFCSIQNTPEESAKVIWSKKLQEDDRTSKIFEQTFLGHIVDVSFFKLDQFAYVVLSSHFEVQSTVRIIEINLRENLARTIQELKSHPIKSQQVFRTNNDVFLITMVTLKEQNHLVVEKFFNNTFVYHQTLPTVANIKIKSISITNDEFIIFQDQLNNTVEIFKNDFRDNYFKAYQTLKFEFTVIDIESFAIYGDGYFSVVTESNRLYLFTYAYVEGWKQIFEAVIKDLRLVVPLQLDNEQYLFVPTKTITTIYKIIFSGV